MLVGFECQFDISMSLIQLIEVQKVLFLGSCVDQEFNNDFQGKGKGCLGVQGSDQFPFENGDL